jgi:transposase
VSGSSGCRRTGWAPPGGGSASRGKSDAIDELAVARAVVKDGAESFPAAYLDEQAMEIRLLSDHRKDLVAERTRIQNRLRWHLLELYPELDRSLARGALEQPQQLDRIDRRLRRMPASASQTRAARAGQGAPAAAARRDRMRRGDRGALDGPDRRRRAILKRRQLRPPTRHRADPVLLRPTRPPPARSRQRPQLNHALHVIAITRARHHPATKTYLARKEAEGKTKKAAHRCLKRHLVRRFHHLLCLPTDTASSDNGNTDRISTEHERPDRSTSIPGTAPTPMPCLA